MIQIEAKTLEEAYSKAAEELGCSVTEVDAEIVQYPSNGILGLFKKNAIISVEAKTKNSGKPQRKEKPERSEKRRERQEKSEKSERPEKRERREKRERPQRDKQSYRDSKAEINVDIDTVLPEIEENVKKLFSKMCFEIEVVSVCAFDDKTVEIKFDGEDAALMIGKDGYRYKALSYVLFNWLNPKYGLLLRLEVAEFLKNQEEMIRNYLTPIKEAINNNGRGQTKVLDGVLVQIALKELRGEFPNKYVAIKTTRDGGKFIVVNDFNRNNG